MEPCNLSAAIEMVLSHFTILQPMGEGGLAHMRNPICIGIPPAFEETPVYTGIPFPSGSPVLFFLFF